MKYRIELAATAKADIRGQALKSGVSPSFLPRDPAGEIRYRNPVLVHHSCPKR